MAGKIVAEVRKLGFTVSIAFPLAYEFLFLKTYKKTVLLPLLISDLMNIPPEIMMLLEALKESVMLAEGKLTPVVRLLIERIEEAPEMYPPEPAEFAV